MIPKWLLSHLGAALVPFLLFGSGFYVSHRFFPRREVETISREILKQIPVPGETKVITVDRPIYLVGPERQIPVTVTRTERQIETKVQTVTLPPEKITQIIERAPQSILVKMEATRDIRQGEKFELSAVQVTPGVYQGLLPVGAPISAEVSTISAVPNALPGPGWMVRLEPLAGLIYLKEISAVVGVHVRVDSPSHWTLDAAGGYSNLGTWGSLWLGWRF